MMKLKRSLLVSSGLLLVVILLTKCFVLKRYVKSDREIEEHYRNKTLKPKHCTAPFLKRSIHYTVMSKSDTLPLLVFVHGAPGAWHGYLNLMDDSLLQTKYKMVSVDRLGYGKSGYGEAELSTDLQAMSIKSVIDKENSSHKKVLLCGRSYGAPITALLAINYPQQTEKLFMISPVIDPGKEKFFWFSKAGRWKAVQWMLPDLLNVATLEKFAHVSEMKMMLPKWEKLCVPTVVVTGGKDKIADPANFDFAKKCLVNCDTTLLKLPGAGHRITSERPELIKQLLLGGTPKPVLVATAR